MVWSYSPRSVVKARRVDFSGGNPKPPIFLLVIMGICAAVLVFAIVSELVSPSDSKHKNEVRMMPGGNKFEQKKKSQIARPGIPKKTSEKSKKKEFRIILRKPGKAARQLGTWGQEKAKESKDGLYYTEPKLTD